MSEAPHQRRPRRIRWQALTLLYVTDPVRPWHQRTMPTIVLPSEFHGYTFAVSNSRT